MRAALRPLRRLLLPQPLPLREWKRKKDVEVFVYCFFKLHNYHLLFYPGIGFNFPLYKTETVWHYIEMDGKQRAQMLFWYLFCFVIYGWLYI